MTAESDPSGEPGCIVVKRRNIVQDTGKTYTVLIDDSAVGKMWAMQTKSF